MNPSKLLQRFLRTGEKPSSQRDTSAILDESRSILASKLPTTGETIMNFTETELASVNLKGGNVLDQMHKVYIEKQNFTPSNAPSKMKLFPQTPKASTSPVIARTAPTARPAPAPVATSKPAAVVHRATATSTKPTATAPSPKLTTAAEFQTKPLHMDRAEFNKLNAADKMRFVKAGGKLA